MPGKDETIYVHITNVALKDKKLLASPSKGFDFYASKINYKLDDEPSG